MKMRCMHVHIMFTEGRDRGAPSDDFPPLIFWGRAGAAEEAQTSRTPVRRPVPKRALSQVQRV
jgi:hypothetical protein